jgi:threonylcarbamoyladenosine tRNA methylthiotransferase MtaB
VSSSPLTRLRVGIQTLGCRLNQYESDGILNRFAASDRYEVLAGASAAGQAPDIAIINTCTVTDQADSRNRQAIKAALKKNPACRVIVTGCFAQTDPEKLREIPGVRLVVGNDRKAALFDLIDDMIGAESRPDQIVATDPPRVAPDYAPRYHPEPERFQGHAINGQYGPRPVLQNPFAYGDVVPMGHTRAYLKIQDGCDRRCTYCKIPMARGRGVSRPLADILEHVRRLDDDGVPEIVLTGVNLGWYRDRAEGVRFPALVERILGTLRQGRLRLSSIEPCDVDSGLAELSLHPRFCDFLHVPLQSGSARILKAMRRTYSPFSFMKRMEKVLAINPELFAGTDVIVGFPGESAADFEDTLALCRDTGMANIHGFRYSPRSGTPAAAFAEPVPHREVRARMDLLVQTRVRGFARYAARFAGQVRYGIVEKQEDAWCEALTDNYLRVRFEVEADRTPPKGVTLPLRILTQNADGTLAGEWQRAPVQS